VVGRDQITASYRLNGMNKPQITVDRRTGLITAKAITDFSGRCDVGNWQRPAQVLNRASEGGSECPLPFACSGIDGSQSFGFRDG